MEVVPINWYDECDLKVKWPPTKSQSLFRQLLLQNAQPADGWADYVADVKYRSGES